MFPMLQSMLPLRRGHVLFFTAHPPRHFCPFAALRALRQKVLRFAAEYFIIGKTAFNGMKIARTAAAPRADRKEGRI
jgi:hypothetical protein